MALAATAVAPQPSSLAEPSWDQTIVPTLRQRLQQESRALTKRLSQHSIISGDESQSQRRPSLGNRAGYGRSATDLLDRAISPNLQRPSAIPRPSMQQYDRQQPPQSAKKPVVTRPPQQRARTQSTPYRYDPADPNPAEKPPLPNGMPTPASSRAASPFNINGAVGSTPARPSRIPMVAPTVTRQRSGSNSSHGNSSTGHGGGGKPNGRPPPSPDASLDLFPVMESGVSASLAGKPRPPRDQPQIRDETAPYDITAQARSSVDSLGERPVQHWYRGDTSRNGGVGEIKVVNRKEMLEIATFGHQPSPTRPLSGGVSTLMAKHRRAGSMEGNRGSWLMDDQAIALTRSVMEEAPLTDLEDGGTDVEASSTGHQQHQQQLQLQQQQQQQQQEQQQEPVPQRPAPVAAPTPTPKPASVPMTPKKAPATRPPSTPQSKVTTPAASSSSRAAQQKRGKPKPTPQKKKTTPATPAKQEPLKEEVEYGDEYSIPYTPQPPTRVGNWDDVVLPAVSKRMGIDGLGVKGEDGIIALPKATPKPSRESMHYEPAPGTFGYDASKAQKRDPREQGDISEFGGISPRKPEPVPEGSPAATPTPSPRRPIRRLPSNLDDRPPSPAPFSDYPPIPNSPTATPKGTPRKQKSGDAMPTIMVHPPSPNGHHVEKIMVEPEGAGCCKCVIM